jgi:hypothetical protein
MAEWARELALTGAFPPGMGVALAAERCILGPFQLNASPTMRNGRLTAVNCPQRLAIITDQLVELAVNGVTERGRADGLAGRNTSRYTGYHGEGNISDSSPTSSNTSGSDGLPLPVLANGRGAESSGLEESGLMQLAVLFLVDCHRQSSILCTPPSSLR